MSSVKFPAPVPLESVKRAIVIGGSSGIGESLVRQLAANGYYVVAVARTEESLAKLCAQINEQFGSEVAGFYVHDVTEQDRTQDIFHEIVDRLGGLDLLVYCAGAQPMMAEEEYSREKDELMIGVNLLSATAWLSLAAERFAAAGAGQLVGLSSIAAVRGRRPNPGYSASKAGLDTYLEGLRNRLTIKGVNVITIRPGFVDTRLLKNAKKAMWVISPDDAAKRILKAVRKRKQVVYIPSRWRFATLVIVHLPSFIFRRLNI